MCHVESVMRENLFSGVEGAIQYIVLHTHDFGPCTLWTTSERAISPLDLIDYGKEVREVRFKLSEGQAAEEIKSCKEIYLLLIH